MKVNKFLKLDKKGLEIFLTGLDWRDIFKDTTEYDFSREVFGLKENWKAKIIKKGQAPIKITSRIWGYDVIRLTIERPGIYFPDVTKLYAVVDFNYETGKIRRTVVYNHVNIPTWMTNGFKDVNWEEIFLDRYIL